MPLEDEKGRRPRERGMRREDGGGQEEEEEEAGEERDPLQSDAIRSFLRREDKEKGRGGRGEGGEGARGMMMRRGEAK